MPQWSSEPTCVLRAAQAAESADLHLLELRHEKRDLDWDPRAETRKVLEELHH